MVAWTLIKDCKIETNEKTDENLVSEIRKVAKENITDVSRIERLVRYAVEGN